MSNSYDLGTLAIMVADAADRVAKAASYAELDQAASEVRRRITEMRRLARVDSLGGNALLGAARELHASRTADGVRALGEAAGALTETVTLTAAGAAAAGVG